MSVNVFPSEVASPATLPASIRASGALRLVVAHTDSGSAAEDIAESGPLRVRFPRIRRERLEAILINTAGGIVGGDRLAFQVETREDASLSITSQAAEKIYRSNGLTSRISVSLKAEAGSELFWLPQETILFDRARVEREIEADVSSDGSLSICEAVVFGRDAMGEKVERGLLRDRWKVRRDGKLIFADALTLDGDIKTTLNRRAAMNGKIAMATLICVSRDAAAKLDAVRDALTGEGIEAGASTFEGMLVARILAEDSISLRAAVLSALEAAGTPPPRAYSL
ncbi:MAG: urease accessory protein UreD [Xanthobacteraceae bacterium]|nr:urease accessory protein UreD [Xanthobacteraceae bacterium]MBX3534739.1 urease accessory protein UreD [Xanthobacteraceae bacterium]